MNSQRKYLLLFIVGVALVVSTIYLLSEDRESIRETFKSKEGYSFTYSPRLFPFVYDYDKAPLLLLNSDSSDPTVRIVISKYTGMEAQIVSDEEHIFNTVTQETILKKVRRKVGALEGTVLEAGSEQRKDYMFISGLPNNQTIFLNLILLNPEENAIDESAFVKEFYSLVKSLKDVASF